MIRSVKEERTQRVPRLEFQNIFVSTDALTCQLIHRILNFFQSALQQNMPGGDDLARVQPLRCILVIEPASPVAMLFFLQHPAVRIEPILDVGRKNVGVFVRQGPVHDSSLIGQQLGPDEVRFRLADAVEDAVKRPVGLELSELPREEAGCGQSPQQPQGKQRNHDFAEMML